MDDARMIFGRSIVFNGAMYSRHSTQQAKY
jgi:hypothetical protein